MIKDNVPHADSIAVLFLILLLYLRQGLVLSFRHKENSKDQYYENHSRIDPEETMQSDAINDVT